MYTDDDETDDDWCDCCGVGSERCGGCGEIYYEHIGMDTELFVETFGSKSLACYEFKGECYMCFDELSEALLAREREPEDPCDEEFMLAISS